MRAFCSNDWELLIPLGRLSQKLGRPAPEAVDLYGRASDAAGLVVLPIYRLHASRAKLLGQLRSRPETWAAIEGLGVADGLMTSAGVLTSGGGLTSGRALASGREKTADAGGGAGDLADVWEGLKAVARHCFLPATARRLRGLGMKAEVRGAYEGEEHIEEKVPEGDVHEETVQKSDGKIVEQKAAELDTDAERPEGVTESVQRADQRLAGICGGVGDLESTETGVGVMEVEGGTASQAGVVSLGTDGAGPDVGDKRPETQVTGPEGKETGVESEGRRSEDAEPDAAAPPRDIPTDSHEAAKPAVTAPLAEVWRVLHEDALAGLRFCVSHELKHFHKARFRVAHAVMVGGGGELERTAVEAAKAELEFFFRTAKGAFCVNVWELDAQKKK